jgi:2-oxoisovalerate dehydrogenase E2 component (dihydrolipoyl transacylase)
VSSSHAPTTSEAPSKPKAFKPLPTRPSAGERREPVRGYARLMVQSMNESLKIPHFGYSDEVSMRKLDALRKELKVIGEQYGVKMSYMPMMIKAASIALTEFPILNSSLSDDESEIIYKGDHNIGVAMDTEKGLVVPNIKGVQNLSVLEIAGELNRLQAEGQGGAGIASKDLEGTTFTLSNIGAIGGTYMGPVIAKPQVAIGALGKIQTLPRFDEDGGVVAEKIMAVSWAGDHRIVDGATMARFSNRWKEMLENPGLMVATLK